MSPGEDRKSTRLNSSHVEISYAVFCLKKKRQQGADLVDLPPRGRNPALGLTARLPVVAFGDNAHDLLFFFNDPATTEIYPLSLHDALPIWLRRRRVAAAIPIAVAIPTRIGIPRIARSEEHTSELQSRRDLVCRLLLAK